MLIVGGEGSSLRLAPAWKPAAQSATDSRGTDVAPLDKIASAALDAIVVTKVGRWARRRDLSGAVVAVASMRAPSKPTSIASR
jgi:hypothetical protein